MTFCGTTLRVWIAGAPSPLKMGLGISLLAIALSYPVVPGTGAQSVTVDRDTRHSDYSNKDEGVRQ